MDKQKSLRCSCRAAGRVTARLLLSFLAVSTTSPVVAALSNGWTNELKQAPLLPVLPPPKPVDARPSLANLDGDHNFTLRHVFHHGTYLYPNLHRRLDVIPDEAVWSTSQDGDESEKIGILNVRSRMTDIQRLADRTIASVDPLLSAARLHGKSQTLPYSSWVTEPISSPNTTDKKTILSFANIAANAYIEKPGTEDWSDVKGGFNQSQGFGWEGDGLRGHIYVDQDNSTIIIGLKGTTPAVFDGADTTTNDKVNDNLFFSCCCGQGGQYLWRPVCDCMTTAYTCNETCLVKALRNENRYYRAAIELYGNVTEIYPNANVWMAGHSLGGSVSALLGLTFGLPVVTFEAPPEALAASRLGLPSPPDAHSGALQSRKNTGAYHFGHTADPIFMGICNSATSACTLGGYAMESRCHTGNVCIYDVVEDKGWRVGVGTHRIRAVIKDVIEAYDALPDCITDSECIDCFNWKYFESNGSDSTTSTTSSTSTAQTRTTTCKTPGWWGCLDESTTSTTHISTSSQTSSTSSTTTCKTMGWFGCKDSTVSEKTATAVPMLTTTSVPVSLSLSATLTTTTSCNMPGLLWGCRDKSTTSQAHKITPPPQV